MDDRGWVIEAMRVCDDDDDFHRFLRPADDGTQFACYIVDFIDNCCCRWISRPIWLSSAELPATAAACHVCVFLDVGSIFLCLMRLRRGMARYHSIEETHIHTQPSHTPNSAYRAQHIRQRFSLLVREDIINLIYILHLYFPCVYFCLRRMQCMEWANEPKLAILHI